MPSTFDQGGSDYFAPQCLYGVIVARSTAIASDDDISASKESRKFAVSYYRWFRKETNKHRVSHSKPKISQFKLPNLRSPHNRPSKNSN